MRRDPPGRLPAGGAADGGGLTRDRRWANRGKPRDAKLWGLRPCAQARGGDVSPAAIMGKPLETMGRKATGLRRRKPLCSPGCKNVSKPRETVGRKAK